MTEHAKGPWTWTLDVMRGQGKTYVTIHDPEDSRTVAVYQKVRGPNGEYDAENDANAALIASAPTLAARLEEATALLREWNEVMTEAEFNNWRWKRAAFLADGAR